MYYLPRQLVCDRLRIGVWASYRIFSAAKLAMIASDSVLRVLNAARRGGEAALDFVPSDIITPEQAEEYTGVTARKLLAWTRRTKKVPPHLRINKQTTRFRLSSLTEWLDKMCSK